MNDLPWPGPADERAAGVILYRRGNSRQIEILVLRNAKHRTWGFAKGRAERDESPLQAALREVAEETGIESIDLDPEFVATIAYRVATGAGASHEKLVVYFLGETNDDAVVSDEHDSIRWVAITEARRLIPHANLRSVLDRAEARIDARGLRRREPPV